MYPGLFNAAMFIAGLVWCYVVIARLPQDAKELFEPRGIVWKIAIIFIWILTIIIGIAVVRYGLSIVNNIFGFYRLFSQGG